MRDVSPYTRKQEECAMTSTACFALAFALVLLSALFT